MSANRPDERIAGAVPDQGVPGDESVASGRATAQEPSPANRPDEGESDPLDVLDEVVRKAPYQPLYVFQALTSARQDRDRLTARVNEMGEALRAHVERCPWNVPGVPLGDIPELMAALSPPIPSDSPKTQLCIACGEPSVGPFHPWCDDEGTLDTSDIPKETT